jgi:hypothetical protein
MHNEPAKNTCNDDATCRRSGWQPPKDTGLWEVSARVCDAIQQQMTPAQQEYWAGENGYFSQVRRSMRTAADFNSFA